MTRQEAQDFVQSIVKLRESATDEQALNSIPIYPYWQDNKSYVSGERVRYNDSLYKVLQTHTSQSDWTPDAAASLFAKILIPDSDTIPEWTQPDSTNPYQNGDKVTHNGVTWISIIDNNVWEPGVYGWNELTD